MALAAPLTDHLFCTGTALFPRCCHITLQYSGVEPLYQTTANNKMCNHTKYLEILLVGNLSTKPLGRSGIVLCRIHVPKKLCTQY